MGTCVETLISAMKADAWTPGERAKELDLATVAEYGGGMVGELSGVPRPVLQTVFGKELGRRIWAQGRRSAAAGVANEEVIGGMIEYVSRRAGEALRKNGRQARAIGLRLEYADGVATLHRMRLARPTSGAGELLAAGMELFGRAEARGGAVESVDLKVTSVQAEVVTERAGGLDFAMMSAAASTRA
jgi:impB/mucB/samB family C-terminal domain